MIKNNKNLLEFIRFTICGGIATAVDFVVFGLIIFIISPSAYNYSLIESLTASRELVPLYSVLWGTAIGFSVGIIVNYLISIHYVYIYTDRAKSVKGATKFLVLSLIGLLLNIILMKIAFDYIGLNHWISKIIVTIIVFSYNYLSKRLLIFRNN